MNGVIFCKICNEWPRDKHGAMSFCEHTRGDNPRMDCPVCGDDYDVSILGRMPHHFREGKHCAGSNQVVIPQPPRTTPRYGEDVFEIDVRPGSPLMTGKPTKAEKLFEPSERQTPKPQSAATGSTDSALSAQPEPPRETDVPKRKARKAANKSAGKRKEPKEPVKIRNARKAGQPPML